MTSPSVHLAFALLISAAAIGCGPVPGGTLGGVPAQTPADWSAFVEEGHTFCEIESRPAAPHSIQLDCFLLDQQLYVQSHRWAYSSWWPVESWASIWIQHPLVTVRIGRQLFESRAVHISDPVERSDILKFRGYDPVPRGIAVFRFVARD